MGAPVRATKGRYPVMKHWNSRKKALMAVMGAACVMALAGCARMDTPVTTQPPALSASPQALNSPAPTVESMYKDGTYTAEASEQYAEQNSGWKEYVTLTVAQGKISQVDYDALKDGKKKSETTKEEYPMEPHPSEWMHELETQMMNAQDSAQIDGVTGATQSSNLVKRLYDAALNAARTGNTATVTLADDAEESDPVDMDTDNIQ